jgi:DNA-binding transcriptional regulator of glucitol operon
MSLTHVDPHVSEIVIVWIQSGDLLMVWIQISHFSNKKRNIITGSIVQPDIYQ